MTFKSAAFLYWFTWLLLQPGEITAQGKTVNIDSALEVLPKMPDDTAKVKLLNSISFTFFTINPNEGIKYGERAQRLAETLKWEKGLAGAFHSLGANYYATHDLIQAQRYYWSCLKLNERISDKRGIATGFHNLALIYEVQNNYAKAIDYYKKSFDIYYELKDIFSKLGCLANIANVYEVQKKYPEALSYFLQSLKLCEEMGNERHIAYMSGRIGMIYNFQGEYAKALEYEIRSLATLQKFHDKNDIAAVLANIANIYFNKHNYLISLGYFQKALKISELENSNWSRGFSAKYSGYIGKVYTTMIKDRSWRSKHIIANDKLLIEKARFNVNKAIYFSRLVGDKGALQDSYYALCEIDSLSGNFAGALKAFKQYSIYKDSINSSVKDKEMSRNELEYTYGKQKDSLDFLSKFRYSELQAAIKARELSKLKLKQQLLYSIILISVLVMVGILFLFRHRIQQLRLKNELTKEKTEIKLKEAEYLNRINEISFAAIRTQMNPHFIFNVLNTIQSYVFMNDRKKAIFYLGQFSDLIRKILENSDKEKISLSDEITFLKLYLNIEMARFSDKLKTSVEVSQNLDLETIFIPPMLIQPYAENAIKHGLLHLSGEKRLLIMIKPSNNKQYIEITVDDNGIGRKKSNEINRKRVNHNSFANAANEKRISLFNLLNKKKMKIEIIDKMSADGSAGGTTIVISIPVPDEALNNLTLI